MSVASGHKIRPSTFGQRPHASTVECPDFCGLTRIIIKTISGSKPRPRSILALLRSGVIMKDASDSQTQGAVIFNTSPMPFPARGNPRHLGPRRLIAYVPQGGTFGGPVY